MRILGIDPGFERLGIAIIEKEKASKEKLLFSECFKTSKSLEFTERLKLIGARIEELVGEYKPEYLGIETLFFETNKTTAMRVAEVRGAILYISAKYGLKICEYSPLQIKSAVTGYGKADKQAVMMMVPKLIKIEGERKMIDDELDAIAIAITTSASQKL
jgi:crossover junction endodeoxyribonuclease RuvC